MATDIQTLPVLLNPAFLPAAPLSCAVWWLADAAGAPNFFAADVVAWVLQGATRPVPVIIDNSGLPRSADFQKADTTLRFIGTQKECNDWVATLWAGKGKLGTPIVSTM